MWLCELTAGTQILCLGSPQTYHLGASSLAIVNLPELHSCVPCFCAWVPGRSVLVGVASRVAPLRCSGTNSMAPTAPASGTRTSACCLESSRSSLIFLALCTATTCVLWLAGAHVLFDPPARTQRLVNRGSLLLVSERKGTLQVRQHLERVVEWLVAREEVFAYPSKETVHDWVAWFVVTRLELLGMVR